MIEEYALGILSPQHGSRLYIDPEMPADRNVLMLNCKVEPAAKEVLWFVNGAEYRLAAYPYRIPWPITKGTHRFQAQVPYTDYRSAITKIEVF